MLHLHHSALYRLAYLCGRDRALHTIYLLLMPELCRYTPPCLTTVACQRVRLSSGLQATLSNINRYDSHATAFALMIGVFVQCAASVLV
jgi:hypothetical protein